MRVIARDRHVNGLNGEFLCIKGRFAHPFVNDEARLRMPLIRYKKGGRLIPATWDEAIKFAAAKIKAVAETHGPDALAVVGSPRITNESNYALLKFAKEVIGTENYAATDAFSLLPFLRNLSAPLATHHDIRHAKTIVLIGGEPEELQPLTGKQIRQAVRNGGAKLIIFNNTPIRLKQQASHFVHIHRGTEDAVVLALTDAAQAKLAARKMGVEIGALEAATRLINESEGDVIVMFGGELSGEAQALLSQLAVQIPAREERRLLFHPLPLFNNSIGAHDVGLMNGALGAADVVSAAGQGLKGVYMAGSFLPDHMAGHEQALAELDLLIVQELFETETTRYADVVFPAASFAEVDGTFTNNDGFVQRVRQSISPVHQAKPDWVITSMIATELGLDFNFQMSASNVFKEIVERVPAYAGLRYPLLKDESKPVQAKHQIHSGGDASSVAEVVRERIDAMPDGSGDKIMGTPEVGHELFKIGTLTDKVPQFHLLAAGNPMPETFAVSPLYQITIDETLRQPVAATNVGD
ncbi:MAG: molybdopterin-dependent oxidoreductase [Pyrinomonadaceae bacterium]